jgi:hypothetical protein
MAVDKSLQGALRRLCALSVEHAYDVHREFDWPEEIRHDGLWMSADLLSVAGTDRLAQLSEEELRQLSRYELVNFFSFNVHGIRDLMLNVLACIHTEGFEIESEYFHFFLDEENKHMWFFAEFCRRFGGKIYSTRKVEFPTFADEHIQSFLAFSKILISEQIGDYFNVKMMTDGTLPEVVRQVNRVHHQDEGRHIAMGRRVVRKLYERVANDHPKETLGRIGSYIRRYMEFFLESFYNPAVYRDAGLSDPYGWRQSLINDPARLEFHKKALRSPQQFFGSLDLA